MIQLGNLTEDQTVDFKFYTVDTDNAPCTLAGGPAVSVYKGNNTSETTTGVTLTVDFDSRTGCNHVRIDTSDAFYAVANDYQVVITTGTVDGISVVGAVLAAFSIENRFKEVDVVAIGGDAQSATDLKDFADAGYDPATNKVQGVVLTDTVTTYTGNTPQTGDSYAIVNSGTHGNSALKGLIDTIDGIVDAIVADTNELQTDWANGGRLDLLIDGIKAVTDLLTAAQSEPTGVPSATATPLVKLATIFMMMVNKVDVIGAKKTFYDSAGGAEFEKDLTDDGTTYSESRVNAI
jgi:hypothetical protein